MARALENLCDTLILTEQCRERFLPLAKAEGNALRERGVSMAGISRLHRGYEVSRMAPRYHVVLFTVAGEAILETKQGKARIEKNTMTLLPAGHSYHYAASRRGWTVVWFHLRQIRRWRNRLPDIPEIRPMPNTQRLHQLAELFTEETGDGHETEARHLGAALGKALDRVMENAPTESSSWELQLRAVQRAVEENLAFGWTVEELARRAHVSPQHFHRLALDHWDTPPLRMVTRLRMDHAALLLEHTSLRIGDIAGLVGYSDAFAFSTAFRREKGISPREARKWER